MTVNMLGKCFPNREEETRSHTERKRVHQAEARLRHKHISRLQPHCWTAPVDSRLICKASSISHIHTCPRQHSAAQHPVSPVVQSMVSPQRGASRLARSRTLWWVGVQRGSWTAVGSSSSHHQSSHWTKRDTAFLPVSVHSSTTTAATGQRCPCHQCQHQ